MQGEPEPDVQGIGESEERDSPQEIPETKHRSMASRYRLEIILLAGLAAFILLGLTQPGREFIWQYLWGPVLADARGEPISGIKEGYNPVNTLVYGVVLAVAVYYIYRLLERLHVEIDLRFFAAVAPFAALGSVLRALEDAGMFHGDLGILFISPIIYFVIGFGTIGVLLFSAWLQGLACKGWKGWKGWRTCRAWKSQEGTYLALAILGIDPSHLVSAAGRA